MTKLPSKEHMFEQSHSSFYRCAFIVLTVGIALTAAIWLLPEALR